MILVTGATGTIGRATVAALASRGARFRVGTRTPDKPHTGGGEPVLFDFERPETMRSALDGVESVFLLTPVTDRQQEYTEALLAEAVRGGVRRIVKLSVIGAEQEPGLLLGRMHREGERAIEGSGLAWTFLRPTFFMQNWINYYGIDPTKDSTVHAAHGDGKASWVDAADVGEVAAAALTSGGAHDGHAYTLTGPEALGADEVCALCSERLGHRYTYVPITDDSAREAMRGWGMPPWQVDGYVELNQLVSSGNAAWVSPGVREALGREARSFREYLAQN